jgi:hypothetical protein
MTAFFVLVLDKYDQPDSWVYSASAATEGDLANLDCYEDPPHYIPRDHFRKESSKRTEVRPCAGGPDDAGTIYGLNHV